MAEDNPDRKPNAETPERAAAAQAAVVGALLAGLNSVNAWADPPSMLRALATVFQSSAIGTMKLDQQLIPQVLALVEEANERIAECVAALVAPGDTKN